MQFHNPEVLFALFLLIIPVLVHLFQLRKFRKEYFTNVKFLKRLTRQTRKSSRLKKWLVLTTRLLMLTCIIFAFARPYFPSENKVANSVETVIYVDNSYSMQATGKRGRILERSVQEILESLPEDGTVTLITNNDEFPEATRQDLQQIEYSSTPADLQMVFFKANNYFSTDTSSAKKFLLISDFQNNITVPSVFDEQEVEIYFLPQRAQRPDNISIDTIYRSSGPVDSNNLKVQLRYSGNNPGNTAVSIYNAEELLGKSSVDFADENPQELEFPLQNEVVPEGRIQIEDNSLQFDNILYFSMGETQSIKITSINSADDEFLKRLFPAPEFELISMPDREIDYNAVTSSQVVILNEVEDLQGSLAVTLSSLARDEVVFIIIPSPVGIGPGLDGLLKELGISGSTKRQEQEKFVTGISFQHPLYNNVFEEQVRNFEYPKVQVSYNFESNLAPILRFEDNSSFLIETEGNYFFTAALNSTNSSFTQSPLIVPTFYNMGISALQPSKLYYLLGESNYIEVPVTISGDRILQISSSTTTFIPRQSISLNKVEIITEELPEEPGNYSVINGQEPVMNLSYNVNRNESRLDYVEIPENENIKVLEDVPAFFSTSGFKKEIDTLWKWFVTFAVLFLVIETLLLKYIK